MGFLDGMRRIFAAGHADPVTRRRGMIQYTSYDAAKAKGRRTPPTGLVRDEDRELPPSARRAVVSANRDIHRNFAIVAWAIRKHLDYITTFRFRSKTGNAKLDGRINDLIEWASRKENYDVTGRHPLPRAIRMAEARKIVDGDIFELKLSSGQVQWIEGDRIRTPFAGLPSGLDPARINHGVILGNAGEAMGYVVCRRAKTNDVGLSGQDMAFERVLRSAWVYHHASWDLGRFDQVRGISPLASATNSFRDVYEGVDYALVKAKVAQMFALAIMRDAAPDEAGVSSFANEGAPGEEGSEDTETCTTTSEEEGSAYKDLDINRGPLVLDMEPGDKAEILESATPSTEFQNFLPLVIQIALKAIDLPYSFYDEAWTNYSGQKQAWALYEKSAEVKRSDNRDLLDDWTRWRLGAFIDDGILELPAGMQLRDLKWAWRHAGTPWLDQLKEAVGKIAAIEASIESPIDVIEETTDKDWTEVLDDKAAFLKAHDDRGIPRPAWGIDQGKVMQDSAPAGEGEGGGGKDAKKGGPNMNTKTNRKSAYELGLEMVAAQREEAARE